MKLRQKKKTVRDVVVKSRQGHRLKFMYIMNLFLNGIPRNSRL